MLRTIIVEEAGVRKEAREESKKWVLMEEGGKNIETRG